MEEDDINREIYILRFQNNRLLKYLRANKIFYRKKFQEQKAFIKSLKLELENTRAEKILLEKKNENI